ncbi:hypothetical protein K3729_04040 [Rhodobacteraceae bacterium S2214]|nr:hypothetical protein K3729_04040 [Rhodobacteraceae bacterium S2214]
MTSSLLMMPYGQSNADHHDAGPAFTSDFLDDDRVVIPNDGHGFRGTHGRAPKRPMTGFQKAYGRDMRIQSLALPAAVRYLKHRRDHDIEQVIIRSGAKGGRALLGVKKGDRDIDGIFRSATGEISFILDSYLSQARDIIDIAARKRRPVSRVMIPFLHGEADKGTPYAVYLAELTAMMDYVDQAFADMDLPVHWLMAQPSGTSPTHAGNAWQNRMAIQDIADTRENASCVIANYGYELADAAHLNARSKVMAGELIGMQAAAIDNGRYVPHIRPDHVTASDNTITVTFRGAPKLEIDRTRFPQPRCNFGFQVMGQAVDFVEAVEVSEDGALRLTCAGPLPAQFTLNYAFASRTHADPTEDTSYPFGRGCLREAWIGASLVLPGEQLLRWVPGFTIGVRNEAKSKAA